MSQSLFSIGRPLKLTVVTKRYGVSEGQFAEFLAMYQENKAERRRIDVESMLRTGKSRTIVADMGMQIETIVELSVQTNTETAMLK